MRITLVNTTPYVAQYIVKKGSQIIAALPPIEPGGGVSIPTANTYQITATTIIDGNTYISAPLTVSGSMGFLAQVLQQRRQGTYVFQVVEVASSAPNQLQFQKTCLNPVTFTISRNGKALQSVVVANSFQSETLDIGDTFNIHAVINGATTSVVNTSDPNATVTAISGSTDWEAGYFRLEETGDGIAECAIPLNPNAASILEHPGNWVDSDAKSLSTDAKQLSFSMQRQAQVQWAWAAVAASIAQFYNPSQRFEQCQLASWAFGTATCCVQPGSAACNRPSGLDGALAHVGHLNTVTAGGLAMDAVKAQIDKNSPIALQIRWTSGNGRDSLVITGYDTANAAEPRITVQDPAYGASIVNFNGFPGNYRGGGTWDRTFTTR